jgi:hypothetical protein
MALLAETLVDEWLNRRGFFTMRGLKHGVHEIDLLGIRQTDSGQEAIHVEVQVSMRPVGYIAPLLAEYIPSFAKSKTSAKIRPREIIQPCTVAWVEKKFTSSEKNRVRALKWPGCEWNFQFVHGVVKDEYELEAIRDNGINTISLYEVLHELKHSPGKITGGAGTDFAELIEYYNKNTR